MSSNPQRLQYLFKKYLYDEGTVNEVKEFWKLFSELDEKDPVKQELWQLWHELDEEETLALPNWDAVLDKINAQVVNWEQAPKVSVQRKHFFWRIAAAAAILCVLGMAAYLLNENKKIDISTAANSIKSTDRDIAPGGNKAVLILSNGKAVVLDSMRQGQLAVQGNSKVMKINNGLLAYNQQLAKAHIPGPVKYNTLKTPRGGMYQLVLPDGTKTWLNAASSIRFPVAFTGKERRVEISGEVYFEVAKDENKPFIVKKGHMAISVLGTHFNVMAYDDEAGIKVTLLEGLVRISQEATNNTRLVKRGEQALVTPDGPIALTKGVNMEEAIAWTNNLFWFDGNNIQTVMGRISRWYNIDVEIKGNISQHFTGVIPRDLMVSEVFKVLNKTGKINYKIEGNKIIVSP